MNVLIRLNSVSNNNEHNSCFKESRAVGLNVKAGGQ